MDDIENEFDIGVNDSRDTQHIAEAALYGRLNVGRGPQNDSQLRNPDAALNPEILLITNGEVVNSSISQLSTAKDRIFSCYFVFSLRFLMMSIHA